MGPAYEAQMDAAFFDEHGMPFKITKIVLEPLPGRFRFTIYSGERLIYSAMGKDSGLEILAAAHTAAVLIECHSSLLPPRAFDPERN